MPQVSASHALSAGHCLLDRKVSELGLIVGEHDVTIGSDTPYTVLLRIASVAIHPNFDSITGVNDIALIKTLNTMTFTRGVQPACLPFKFKGESLVNSTVEAIGW